MRARLAATVLVMLTSAARAQAPDAEILPQTARLDMIEPLDVVMVRGINRFAEEEIAHSRERRARHWNRDYSSAEAYEKSIAPNRERLKTYIGAVDERVPTDLASFDFIDSLKPFSSGEKKGGKSEFWRLGVLADTNVDIVESNTGFAGSIILVPDADWSPEMLSGQLPGLPPELQLAARLGAWDVGAGVPVIVDRSDEYSGHPDFRSTNQPHREFLYRPAFELGRHIIGYEVQKIHRLVDEMHGDETTAMPPVVVWGVGEGALLAMYAAATDPRIDVCVVSGYFNERERVWQEPIYRNVWRLLDEFGDAEIASLIAPRRLIIEACAAPEVDGPPAPRDGRNGAAPGAIRTPAIDSVEREFARARAHFEKLGVADHIQLIKSGDGTGPAGCDVTVAVIAGLAGSKLKAPKERRPADESKDDLRDREQYSRERQKHAIDEMRRHTQRLLHVSDKAREKVWEQADRSSLEAWEQTQEQYRDFVYDELIGRISYDLLPPNARSRKVIDEPTHVGYEVVLDVFASPGGAEPIIAGGILLVPKDLKPGEQRPCVVCQHGLEGTPMDTITTDPGSPGFGPYKGFSTQLVKQGYIIYAPQNPYRGHDEFRVIQRKSNPLGRSLFSYIIPQHQQTLNWLAALPYVDAHRIGFYGLSYGGKTAMRVPPMLPPRTKTADAPGRVGYCLSICSADFNEWVLKNATTEDRYSYVFTPEYEIFEWNMGHVANYAELASLMTPRPFMVERGHDDGVAPDEWVAWEFAKVKRHYDRLGIGDRTEIEVFNGPHTINGQGTFDFLRRHLHWPPPQ